MAVTIQQIGPDRLGEYGKVSIAYQVRSVLCVEEADRGLGGLFLREEALKNQYEKDYDACEEGGPADCPKRFDISRWGFFLACDEGQPVGGASVAWNTPTIRMLKGRQDLALLWDIRVCPDRRGQGIGAALFKAAADWAREKGCAFLKIETQNVNVPACRFYETMGCFLGQIDRFAYQGLPHIGDEVMLLWYLDLNKA